MIFTRTSRLHIATGYVRVVHGGRGDYVEFDPRHILWDNTFVPPDQQYRLLDRRWIDKVFYIEHRTKTDYVKVYEQKRLVNYADYKIGMIYIAPADLIRTK